MKVYDYSNSTDFLQAKYEEKKRKNASFSIRSWSYNLGMKTHGGLNEVLAGKRSFPKKYIPQLKDSFGLSDTECLYFETLINYEYAKSLNVKENYLKRLKEIKNKERKINYLEIDSDEYFSNPLHAIIGTLIEAKGFREDLDWMEDKLNFRYSKKEIKEALDCLFDFGILKNENGKIKKVAWGIRNKDKFLKGVEEFHKKMCRIAAEEISCQPRDEREYNSFSVNIKKENIPRAKDKMRKFLNEFMNEFTEEGDDAELTYQLSTQFFALTKEEKNEAS